MVPPVGYDNRIAGSTGAAGWCAALRSAGSAIVPPPVEGCPLPTLSLTSKAPATLTADALVIGVAAGTTGPRLVGDAFPAAVRTQLTNALDVVGASGATDSVHRIPSVAGVSARSVVFTGLGTVRGAVDPEVLRRAAGAATRQLAGLAKVVFALPAPDAAAIAGIGEGALFGAYAYNRYRTGETK